MTIRKKKSIIFRYINRIILYLCLLAFVVMLLYVSGNYKCFLDSMQIILLHAASILSVLIIGFAGTGFLLSLFFLAVSGNFRYVFSIPGQLFAAAYGGIILFAVRILITGSSGI